MGNVDLLIQNWFHRKSQGRQGKGRWPRNFDFLQLMLNAHYFPCVWFLRALFRPILGGRRHDTTPKIKGYWYIGILVETWETDHRVACKFAHS